MSFSITQKKHLISFIYLFLFFSPGCGVLFLLSVFFLWSGLFSSYFLFSSGILSVSLFDFLSRYFAFVLVPGPWSFANFRMCCFDYVWLFRHVACLFAFYLSSHCERYSARALTSGCEVLLVVYYYHNLFKKKIAKNVNQLP